MIVKCKFDIASYKLDVSSLRRLVVSCGSALTVKIRAVVLNNLRYLKLIKSNVFLHFR